VITHDAELPPQAKLLATARQTRTIVVAEEATTAARRMLAARGAELVEVGDAGLRGALSSLADLGLLDILCEGGPTLAGELLAEGLIDRVLLFMAPLFVGRGAPDLFGAPAVHAVNQAWRLTDVEWRPVCDDLLLSGSVVKGGR
jgi:5-amino-6-(5-phosphoribosylamino)uracil reductase